MKLFKILVVVSFLCFINQIGGAQNFGNSVDDAMAIAQRQFKNQDVDYYLAQDYSKGMWSIFVDAAPF